MQFIALGDRIFVIEDTAPETTSTGIYLVGEDSLDYKIGKVVSVGKGTQDSKTPSRLGSGDIVYYSKFAGQRVNVSDQDYVVLRFYEVLAVDHGKISPVIKKAAPIGDKERLSMDRGIGHD
jgi:co-chaperonin GroES (HSP10)